MSKFWSRKVKEAKPYVPGEQPEQTDVIKLNTNENPYPPSQKTLEAMHGAINDDLRRYPTPTVSDLKRKIANREGVAPSNVFVGNGSDEVLAFVFQAFFEPNETIKFPEITYSFYPVYSNLYDISFQKVPLNADLSIDVEGLYDSVGGVIFPNPNAPTGVAMALDDIERILQNNRNQVVIVDEAYVEFGTETAVKLTKAYPNLLVTRTLSKSHALAGIRLGYAVGHEDLIEGLERIKNSFNSYTINRVSLAGAEAALEDETYYSHIINQVIQTREWASGELRSLGFNMTDSKSNFLFVKPARTTARILYESLKERGIYVRYFNQPKIDGYIRISIGTDAEMKILIEQIEEIMST
ncbi:histidinol-phosphate transaminase [Halalkalibacillus sediminis]|uniref:Histidinol-phosphate aminotransferase n=1 Tax=Halalkalibacillus sediminis TaxID=2018042 RepID=A0A2I0QRS9_9BACI|nr:histidinol-phosphate transaminase [Halalkalibacillus sediminis]PKR77033.1 histidinol-phosphate transaminase [Halalkalibacillus sediminis]